MPSSPSRLNQQYRHLASGRNEAQDNASIEQAAGLLRDPITVNSRGIINHGEDDELRIEGYKRSYTRTALCYTAILLTLGILRLLMHWWKHWFLYATHAPCTLSEATKVLITECYNEKHTIYYVKSVETISCDDYVLNKAGGCLMHTVKYFREDYKQKMFSQNGPIRDIDNLEFSVHISNGIFRDTSTIRRFYCKKLCYIWDNEVGEFKKLMGLDKNVPTTVLHHQRGLSAHQQYSRRIVYGSNEIIIPVSSILTLLCLEVLNPFYVFQVFSFCLWFADNYIYYAMAILLMSMFGISMSIIQTRQNQRSLRSTVHSSDTVTVLRGDGSSEVIGTECLVPGDVLEIPSHGCIMHCDAVLLTGNCILNESMLTGESVPVTKTPLPPKHNVNYDTKEHARHTLFCGTRVIQTRYFGNEKVLAVVISTGTITAKGGLVRSIMYPPPVDYKFERDSYRFIAMLAGIAGLGFIYTVVTKVLRGVSMHDIAIESLDLITIVVPPALPAAMTVGRMYAQRRLQNNGIYCISPRTINVSGSIDCVCFDKTGTLTEDGLDMWGVVPTFNKFFQVPLKQIDQHPQNDLLFGMVSCHSITMIDGQMSGDPLDLKMFESTKWILQEHNVADDTKFDMLFPTVVRPPTSENVILDEIPLEIGIVREFPFSSSLQRMSVVTRTLSDNHFKVYCKGSPEMISSLCKPNTLPEDFATVLEKYTQEGYRVIALAYKDLEKKVSYLKVQKMARDVAESELTFLGLIILENRLKADTTKVIENLIRADVKIIMVTGDNILTAISVGKDCGIIAPGQGVITVNTAGEHTRNPQLYYTLAGTRSNNSNNVDCEDLSAMTKSNSIASMDTIESCTQTRDVEIGMIAQGYQNENLASDLSTNNYRFAVTGKTWAIVKEHFPDILPMIITRGAIFARMSPDQKQQLVLELQKLGYYVAMCGDGANDCGALKAAHTGISLSEAESSVASPFTSKNPTIGCVPRVIKEGRCALVTSFGIFKYMAAYSLTQFVSVMILYSIDSNLTDIEFLYIDLFMISVFAFFFGKTEAFSGPLVKQKPLNSLMSISPILSLILQMLLVIGFQMTAFFHVINEPWYVPFDGAHKESKNSVGCNENYAIFSMSSFQYIILAIVFSKGAPYRKSIFSNYGFMISCVVMTAFTVYLTLIPHQIIADFMDLVVTKSFQFRLYIVFYGLLHFCLAVFVEVFIVEYLVFGKMRPRWHNIHKSRRKFLSIEDHLRKNTKWPPLCDNYAIEPSTNTSVQNSPSYSSFCVEKRVSVPLEKNNVLNNFLVKESNVHETVDDNLNITPSCGFEMAVKPIKSPSKDISKDIAIIMDGSLSYPAVFESNADDLVNNKHYKITNGIDNVITRYGYEMSHLPTS